MSQRARAPEKMRTNVNVAASMEVCFSARRQSRELLAKAIIASRVRKRSRAGFTVPAQVKINSEAAGNFPFGIVPKNPRLTGRDLTKVKAFPTVTTNPLV